jgi:hypothetical protein
MRAALLDEHDPSLAALAERVAEAGDELEPACATAYHDDMMKIVHTRAALPKPRHSHNSRRGAGHGVQRATIITAGSSYSMPNLRPPDEKGARDREEVAVLAGALPLSAGKRLFLTSSCMSQSCQL